MDIKRRDFFTEKFNKKYKAYFVYIEDYIHNIGKYSVYNKQEDISYSINIHLPEVWQSLVNPISLKEEKVIIMRLMNLLITNKYDQPIQHPQEISTEKRREINKKWMETYNEIFYQLIDKEKWQNAT